MHGRWERWAGFVALLLFVLGPPVGALILVVGASAFHAFGPGVLAGGLLGQVLMSLSILAAMALVVFSSILALSGPSFWSLVLWLVATGSLFFGLLFIDSSMRDWVLQQRGEVTTCTISEVTKQVRTRYRTDAQGNRTIREEYVVYDYRLACTDPRVQEMTISGLVGKTGEEIEVRHDPVGRLSSRPAGSVDALEELRLGAVLYGTGIVVRLLGALNVPGFYYDFDS